MFVNHSLQLLHTVLLIFTQQRLEAGEIAGESAKPEDEARLDSTASSQNP